jgi:hypothetical protein
VLQEEAAKDEIATVEAAAHARSKEASEAAAADLAKVNQQKRLDAIAWDEAAQKAQIQSELLQTKRAKVSKYLGTPEGKALAKQIEAKFTQVLAKDAEEKSPIRKKLREMEKQSDQAQAIMDSPDPLISSADRTDAGRLMMSLQLRIRQAKEEESNQRPSPALDKMWGDLRTLQKKSGDGCGLDYDEAMAVQNTATKKPQALK